MRRTELFASLMEFCESHCAFDIDAATPVSDVWAAYLADCREHGRLPYSRHALARHLRAAFPECRPSTKSCRGKSVRVHLGIVLLRSAQPQNASAREAAERRSYHRDSAEAFCEERLVEVPGRHTQEHFLLSRDLWEMYQQYCEEGKKHMLSKEGFFRTLRDVYRKARKERKRVRRTDQHGKLKVLRPWGYRGLRFVSNDEDFLR